MSLLLLFRRGGGGPPTQAEQFEGLNGAMYHVLLATRNVLRDYFVSLSELNQNSTRIKQFIDIQPEGHPPPTMGSWYIAVDEVAIVPVTHNASLEEEHQIMVAITREVRQNAADRLRAAYEQASLGGSANPGLDFLEQVVKWSIHGNNAVRIQANSSISLPADVSAAGHFRTPLYFTGRQNTTIQSGDWAGCEPDQRVFAVRRLLFTGMKANASMTLMRLGPCALSATVNGNDVSLEWANNSELVTGFKIYRSSDLGSSYTLLSTVDESVTTYTDENLSAGTYVYYVASIDESSIEYPTIPEKVTVS